MSDAIPTGASLPAQWQAAGVFTAIDGLLATYQFGLIRRLLDQSSVSAKATALATLGQSLITLDMHDESLVELASGLDAQLAQRVIQVAWPSSREAQPRGPMQDLVPTYQLLSEVLAIHSLRGETSSVLAVLHLMAEYLPLLAWGTATGDAGDPMAIELRLRAEGALWHTDNCPLNRLERGGFTSVLGDEDWENYVRERHSRIASALSVCGGVPHPVVGRSSGRVCRTPCAVMSGVADIAWRMTLARRFRASDLLQLRHDAPVGHFFAVPSASQVEAAWENTWHALLMDSDETPVGRNPLTGLQPQNSGQRLAGLLGYIAGQNGPLAPGTLVADVATALRRELEPHIAPH